jgi:hypothetical protein
MTSNISSSTQTVRTNYTNTVNIYVKELAPDCFCGHDLDDQCMKVAVESFKFADGDSSGNYINQSQAVFYLRDLTSIAVKYVCESQGAEKFPHDKDIDIAACAAESILKHLYKAGCTKTDNVTFQARYGNYDLENGTTPKVSGIFTIGLKEKATKSSVDSEAVTISHSYAYLSERKLCVFFKTLTSAQMKKIDNILQELFPATS